VENQKIILFDGVCNFCNFWVNFIIDRDNKNFFKFAALQSEKGQELLERYQRNKNLQFPFHHAGVSFDTFVLIDGDRVFTKSTAVFKVSRYLKGIWRLFYFLIFIPRPIRDFIYTIVATNRYKYFGRRNACRIPTEQEKDKFLA
jgi:predicted DCC family thiol-disulfide oxidoreductase YuxK